MFACRTPFLVRSLLLAGLLPAALVGCKPANAPSTAVTVVRYDVQGMHCDGCVNAITAKVLKVKGVASCEVSLDQHLATIGMSDPSQAPEVEAAITKLGYTVGPETGEPADQASDDADVSPKTNG